MKNELKPLVDELAKAIFAVLSNAKRLKQPAAIAVGAGLSGGPSRVVRRSETVWQDYRPEARAILKA